MVRTNGDSQVAGVALWPQAAHLVWAASVLLLVTTNPLTAMALVHCTSVTYASQVVQAVSTVRGVVLDPSGQPVAGAIVRTDAGDPVQTDEEGHFFIMLEPGDHELEVLHRAHMTLRLMVQVVEAAADLELEIHLDQNASVEESVSVVGIRASEDVPVTKRNLNREEIDSLSYGQDAPALLQTTPSITTYSDSGSGSNYSYFSVRGIQQTRINMTFDGAPLNDPAEHALYFNNFHDFTNTVDSIQIQRGVGTSSVGSPSYGGSVNFASPGVATSRRGDVRLVLGSFDTKRASVGYQSGIIGNGFHVAGRFSYSNTEGYRDHSGNEHHTLFLNTGWQGDRFSLKLVAFSGNEAGNLSWLAVDPDTLRINPRANLLDERETENFGQDFAQLKYTRSFGNSSLLTASLYYNGAQGWFRLWDDPVAQKNLLQFGIDQHFIGSMITFSRDTDQLSLTAGAHYNDFQGNHDLHVLPGRVIGSNAVSGGPVYLNTGFKKTANFFGKANYRLGNSILFGDLQLRWAKFSYDGEVDLGSIDWLFLDPRVGIRHHLSDNLSLYATVGRAQREPARLDLLVGEDNASVAHDLEAVSPEVVLDFEAGLNLNTPRWSLQANFYAMEFTDEIALTGELSDIGLPMRRNVDASYRRGLEIDLRWTPMPNWSLLHSLNVSHNRIREWTQHIDIYDEDFSWIGSEPTVFKDTPPLLTPGIVANLGIGWSKDNVSFAAMVRQVAVSQLDNTGLESLRLPSYTNVDVSATFGLGRWLNSELRNVRPQATIFINNLTNNDQQYPSGYSYQYIARSSAGDFLNTLPFYYPLAIRHVVVSLQFDL